jgi:iron(III) transport system ATP-binding protein
VTSAAYLGARMEYSIATEIGRVFVTGPGPEEPLAPGSPVALTLADRGVTLIRPRVQ